MPEETKDKEAAMECQSKEKMTNSLASYFSSLFYVSKNNDEDDLDDDGNNEASLHKSSKKERRSKCKKCSRSKSRLPTTLTATRTSRTKRTAVETLGSLSSLPDVKLSPNPSAFAVFDAVRRVCLQRGKGVVGGRLKGDLGRFDNCLLPYQDTIESVDASVYSGELSSSSSSSQEESGHRSLPRVVDAGLKMVFEMVEESENLYPTVCLRALRSLLDILQGLMPEEIACETSNKLWSELFQTLQRLSNRQQAPQEATRQRTKNTDHDPDLTAPIRALAKACLLSLAIARGDTSMLLASVVALLISDEDDLLAIPKIFVHLQRSVISAILGTNRIPTFTNGGLSKSGLVDSFHVRDVPKGPLRSMVCEQGYLYLVIKNSIVKVGTGYNDTPRSRILIHRPHAVESNDRVALHLISQRLYVVTMTRRNGTLELVGGTSAYREEVLGAVSNTDRQSELLIRVQEYDKDCLKAITDHSEVALDSSNYHTASSVISFSDSKSLGVMSLANEEGDSDSLFSVKFFDLDDGLTNIKATTEMKLKLTNVLVQYIGRPLAEKQEHNKTVQSESTITIDTEHEVIDMAAGKDFNLMISAHGKLFFTGKAESLGLKCNNEPTHWSPVMVAKSPQLNCVSVGHDGEHALLLGNDGIVYFVGLAKRGEDGGVQKPRGVKPCRPKKFNKPSDNVHVVQVACNNGSSALVTKDGELLLYGKDNHHSNYMGVVSGLKGHFVTKVALGKAHVVAVTKRGECFTFGMNNKAQCGRDFIAPRNAANNVDVGENDDDDIDERGTNETQDSKNRENVDGKDSIKEKPIRRCVHHDWRDEKCLVCPMCLQCTGYGPACVSSKLVGTRIPRSPCGCGAGDAGCSICGICRRCASEEDKVDDSKQEKNEHKKDNYPSKMKRGPKYLGSGHGGSVASVKEVVGALLEQEADFFNNDIPNQLEPGGSRDRALQQQVESYRLMTHLNRIRSRRKGVRRSSKDESSSSLKTSVKTRSSKSNILSMGDQSSDHDTKELYSKQTSLAPAPVILSQSTRVTDVSCGHHHTLLLTSRGQALSFGANNQGQLGTGDLIPRGTPTLIDTKEGISAITCGAMHSVLLTQRRGELITFGAHEKGQLGRFGPKEAEGSTTMAQIHLWYAFPHAVDGIGSQFGKRCVWIKGNGDRTFIRIEQRLLSEESLSQCSITADEKSIVIWPRSSEVKGLVINRGGGKCSILTEGIDLSNQEVCLDSKFDVMWTLDKTSLRASSHNAVMSVLSSGRAFPSRTALSLLSPGLSVPNHSNLLLSSSLAGQNLLCCLNTLANTTTIGLVNDSKVQSMPSKLASETKETVESSFINRFNSLGGGWGYSGHSIEAIRFMVDTDLVIEGFCLYGGRGQYVAKIKLFDLFNSESESMETDLDLLAESEEIQYQVEPRSKHSVYFNEPVSIVPNKWYLAWARICGPGSDCGAGGMSKVFTEDGVVFTFRNSRQSNNGTDVTNGQIPSIIYRLINDHDRNDKGGNDRYNNGLNIQNEEEIWTLSNRFARTVNEESLMSLNKLLNWAWQNVAENEEDRVLQRSTVVLSTSLRLIVGFVNKAYSFINIDNSLDTSAMADAVYETKILFEGLLADESLKSDLHVMTTIQESFVACFHIFFPTGQLKWAYLCRLLSEDRKCVLGTVLEALCLPLVPLKHTFPITYSPENESTSHSKVFSPTLEASMMVNTTDNYYSNVYPTLCQQMSLKSHCEPLRCSSFTFREVLDRLLKIICVPIKQRLRGKVLSNTSDFELEEKASSTVAAVIAELISPHTTSSTTTTTEPANIEGSVLRSPSRFGLLKDNRLDWLSGNGAPDAIAFSVDRDLAVVGCVVFADRSKSADIELEVLEERQQQSIVGSLSSQKATSKTQWRVLARYRDTFSKQECNGSKVGLKETTSTLEVRLKRAVKIRQGSKYALLLRNHGGNATPNGENGVAKVKGADDTTFVYCNSQLSLNGTNVSRGQIPSILYSTVKVKKQSSSQATRMASDSYARRAAVAMSNTVLKALDNVLMVARETIDYEDNEDSNCTLRTLNEAPLIRILVPKMLAQISALASVDAASAVQLFSLFQTILPSVVVFNRLRNESIHVSSGVAKRHATVVESPHPYRSEASVKHYRVLFSNNVKWISLEFDGRCHTCQPDDNLQILLPCGPSPNADNGQNKTDTCAGSLTVTNGVFEADPNAKFQVFKRFSLDKWPKMATILPGNEIVLAFETASLQDAKNEKSERRFGFRCMVTGFEGYEPKANGLRHLELELAFAASTCLSALMHNDIVGNESVDSANMDNSSSSSQLSSSQLSSSSSSVQETFLMHSSLLGRGLALDRCPSIKEAFHNHLPFVKPNKATLFLSDFLEYNLSSKGGKLALWLQPESFVDVNKCCVNIQDEDVTAGFPNHITVRTLDQYGRQVVSPSIKVSIQAVPEMRGPSTPGEQQGVEQSSCPSLVTHAFGGHDLPDLSKKYSVTLKDKFVYHSITMMKSFENYSFEELRLASPMNTQHQKKAENLLVKMRPDEPGLYEAVWSPSSSGTFELRVTIDSYVVRNSKGRHMIKVKNARIPDANIRPISFESESRSAGKATKAPRSTGKFVLRPSSGLRIRLQPSLQSEQIGVVPVDGQVVVVDPEDEVVNKDGKWVKIGEESIKQFCSKPYDEAYCLQFNAHLNKVLLVTENIGVRHKLTQSTTTNTLPSHVKGGLERPGGKSAIKSGLKHRRKASIPANYVVTRCGPAGHNVRVRPSFNSSVIGRLQLGERVKVIKTEDVEGELWLKLDCEKCNKFVLERQMRRRHDHIDREEDNGLNEMWVLAKNVSKVSFLEDESWQREREELSRASSSSSLNSTHVGTGVDSPYKTVHMKATTALTTTTATPPASATSKPLPLALESEEAVDLGVNKPSIFDKLGFKRSLSKELSSTASRDGASMSQRRPLSSSPPSNRRNNLPMVIPSKNVINERQRQRTNTAVGPSRVMSNNNGSDSPPSRASSASPKRGGHRGVPVAGISGGGRGALKPRVEPRRRIEMALTPSVAESVRCVFAALLWHEHLLDQAEEASESLLRSPQSKKSDDRSQMSDTLLSMLDLWTQVASYCAHAMAHQLILYNPKSGRATQQQQEQTANSDVLRSNDAKRVRLNGSSSNAGVVMRIVATRRPSVTPKTITSSNTPTTATMTMRSHLEEAHRVMMRNARFLLELSNDNDDSQNEDEKSAKTNFGGARSKLNNNSAMAKKGKVHREGKKRSTDVMSESFISELALVDPNPMSSSTFQCLPMLSSDMADENFDLTNFLVASDDDDESSDSTPTKAELSAPKDVDVLNSSVMSFVLQYHDLGALRQSMIKALRQSAYRIFALQGFDWLLRAVSQPAALHDMLWLFSIALKASEGDKTITQTTVHGEQTGNHNSSLLPHPLISVKMAGKTALMPLQQNLHSFLQSLANLMPHLPSNSALQLASTQACSLRLVAEDQVFLLGSKTLAALFLQVSKVVTDEIEGVRDTDNILETWKDTECEVHTSSRSAMAHALSDRSTETFWESGEEDRFKSKWIALKFNARNDTVENDEKSSSVRVVAIFVDNVRGLNHRVTSVAFEAYNDQEDVSKLKGSKTVRKVDLDTNHVGWLTCFFTIKIKVMKLVLNGPADAVRIWQVQALEADKVQKSSSSSTWQRRLISEQTVVACRLLTRQLLQRLLRGYDRNSNANTSNKLDNDHDYFMEGDETQDRLERQTLNLCLRWLRRRSESMLVLWEQNEHHPPHSDIFSHELLSLLLDLAETNGLDILGKLMMTSTLMEDIVTILHIGSPDLQSICVKLLHLLLPGLSPDSFVELLDLQPLSDLSESQPQLLDVFLALISKGLQVQIRTQDSVVKSKKLVSVTSSSTLGKSREETRRWYLSGVSTKEMSQSVIRLLKTLTSGSQGELWQEASRKAISNNLANLTRIERRGYPECVKNETLWLALASLCVLDKPQVDNMAQQLDSDDALKGETDEITMCDNHDDGLTSAALFCVDCQLALCPECDRVLHLRRDVRQHQRHVLSHEEESLRLDVHEGCGRAKLYWLIAMADSRTLKAMLEFRALGSVVNDNVVSKIDKSNKSGVLVHKDEQGCRFCGQKVSSHSIGFLEEESNVCDDEECQQRSKSACNRRLDCGHMCNGVLNETQCPPCLRSDCKEYEKARDEGLVKQDGETMCVICFVDRLQAAPVVQLKCGHIFHLECCRRVLNTKWSGGPRITFGFMLCPLCKTSIEHEALDDLIKPLEQLLGDVKSKALMRLEYENLSDCDQIVKENGAFHNDPVGFALNRYAYYLCFKCDRAYYGGLVECALEAGDDNDDFDESELVCGGCSDIARAQMCAKHGADFLEYKCRYCCSVAIFFCFGTTHFCKTCHDHHQHVASIPKAELPQCPVAPGAKEMQRGAECPLKVKHPPTGEEFALGCGICRNANTF